MTTLTNTETLEEVVQRILAPTIGKVAPAVYRELVSETVAVLRNERQRAVDIARGEDCGLNDCLCAVRIAAMIRGVNGRVAR